jgi:hypothetical protein
MNCRRETGIAWLLTAVLLSGCGSAPGPAGTGAQETVQGFYEAILRQDWTGAYAAVHPENRARCGAEQFSRLAQSYRRGFGFEPDAVHVRSCEEHEKEAIAHIAFSNRGGPGRRYYRDAVTLRRTEAGWGVVLPANFGRALTR